MHQPEVKGLLYIDICNLLMIFLVTLLADFTERSIQFNIVATGVFLFKCIIGTNYRDKKSYTALRNLMVIRLMIDALIVMPLIAFFRKYSATSSYNLLMVFFVTITSQLFVILRHFANLFFVSTIECIEQISPPNPINVNGFPQ